MGRLSSGWAARSASQDWSPHSWVLLSTMLAVFGGVSVALASGSALRTRRPSARMTRNLYLVPAARPGTKSSQIPLLPSERIGWARASHPLASLTRPTPRALGAQTAKATPLTPWCSITLAPSRRQSSRWVPSPMRWRSRSPSEGQKRYGSSISQLALALRQRSR